MEICLSFCRCSSFSQGRGLIKKNNILFKMHRMSTVMRRNLVSVSCCITSTCWHCHLVSMLVCWCLHLAQSTSARTYQSALTAARPSCVDLKTLISLFSLCPETLDLSLLHILFCHLNYSVKVDKRPQPDWKQIYSRTILFLLLNRTWISSEQKEHFKDKTSTWMHSWFPLGCSSLCSWSPV